MDNLEEFLKDHTRNLDGTMQKLCKDVAVVTEIVRRVEVKQTTQNGSIATALHQINKLKQWRSWMVGFGVALTTIIMPGTFFILNKYT